MTPIAKNLNEIMKKENLFHTFLDKKMERIYQKKLISVFPFLSMLSDFRETQLLPAPNHFRPGTQILLCACSCVRVVCPRQFACVFLWLWVRFVYTRWFVKHACMLCTSFACLRVVRVVCRRTICMCGGTRGRGGGRMIETFLYPKCSDIPCIKVFFDVRQVFRRYDATPIEGPSFDRSVTCYFSAYQQRLMQCKRSCFKVATVHTSTCSLRMHIRIREKFARYHSQGSNRRFLCNSRNLRPRFCTRRLKMLD